MDKQLAIDFLQAWNEGVNENDIVRRIGILIPRINAIAKAKEPKTKKPKKKVANGNSAS